MWTVDLVGTLSFENFSLNACLLSLNDPFVWLNNILNNKGTFFNRTPQQHYLEVMFSSDYGGIIYHSVTEGQLQLVNENKVN